MSKHFTTEDAAALYDLTRLSPRDQQDPEVAAELLWLRLKQTGFFQVVPKVFSNFDDWPWEILQIDRGVIVATHYGSLEDEAIRFVRCEHGAYEIRVVGLEESGLTLKPVTREFANEYTSRAMR